MRKVFPAIFIFIFLIGGSNAQIYDRQRLWENEINAFAEIDREQPPPANAVLFVGDDSIRKWTNLRSSFPRMKVINRGLGGSRLEDVNYYFNKIVAPYKPKTIVLCAGENDLNEGVSPEQIVEQYKYFALAVKIKLPETEILFVAVKPSPIHWQAKDRIKRVNELLKAAIEKERNSHFVDVFAAMLDENENPQTELFREDKLNVSEKGYAVWRNIIQKYLR